MLFYSFFRTLGQSKVAIELKNGTVIVGTFHSMDQYMNVRLDDIQVDEVDLQLSPQLALVSSLLIRGSNIASVSLPAGIDHYAMIEATRHEVAETARLQSESLQANVVGRTIATKSR